MSHELRTPLNAILGFTQLMSGDERLNEQHQEYLNIINKSGEHLLTLINDVLEMSKIEAGKVSIQERSFDLSILLESLEELFIVEAEDKGLQFIFEIDENVPQYVVADERRLRQVLMNLIGNAVKFTEEGSVTLRLIGSVTTDLPDDSLAWLHFAIEDTGPGIPLQEMDTIFEPFVQSERDEFTRKGTGLGLSISKQFVELMGGTLQVISEVGKGTVFNFAVQYQQREAGDLEPARSGKEVIGIEADQPEYRILVAEDREENRRLLVDLLTKSGFSVREAVNGQEAMDIRSDWEPDLIWMDIRMPVVNGLIAARSIREQPQGNQIPIIALTATAFDDERDKQILDVCNDLVRKPFRQNEIFEMLIKHLGVRFVYAEQVEVMPKPQPSKQVISAITAESSSFSNLPSDKLSEINQAAISADYFALIDVSNEIAEQFPSIAGVLRELTEDFQYDRILNMLNKSQEEDH